MCKRLIAFDCAVIILFVSLVARIGYISLSNEFLVNSSYNSYSLTIDLLKPNLYYSNGGLITNNTDCYYAVIRNNKENISELSSAFTKTEINDILSELKQGYPVVKRLDKYYDLKYIQVVEGKTSDNTLSQLVSKSSSGLMTYLPDYIGERKICFGVDALGNILQGDKGSLYDNGYGTKEGLKLTIDSNVQRITYDSSSELNSGCVVVMDVESGNILSVVSKPDNTYLNKAFSQYSVGSVFKLAIAACSIKNNIDLEYNCTSKIVIGDSTFSCQGGHAHGVQNLSDALANSCNCYFVNLALRLGKTEIEQMTNSLGFNKTTRLYNDWNIVNAVMPTNEDMSYLGELAQLGFGQGKLTSSPMQICSMLCSLSCGYYKQPRLIDGGIDPSGKFIPYSKSEERRELSKDETKKLLSYLHNVVENGTGYNAKTKDNLSAGKTATAETGQYVNGIEKYNTWFAGVYPYNNPKYAIVVMCENGKSGAEDCCPIFRTIVEKLVEM